MKVIRTAQKKPPAFEEERFAVWPRGHGMIARVRWRMLSGDYASLRISTSRAGTTTLVPLS